MEQKFGKVSNKGTRGILVHFATYSFFHQQTFYANMEVEDSNKATSLFLAHLEK